MNIIKFIDVEKVGDTNFNLNYKGKYCWWVNCKWAVLFDYMSMAEYITASKNNNVPELDIDYLVVENYQQYIDERWTEKINNEVNNCKELNKYVNEIPLDKLKVFRTWLAQSLIDIAADTEEYEVNTAGYGYKIDTMLNYYAKNMMDSTTVALANFATGINPTTGITTSSCACNQTQINLSALSLSSCDANSMYHSGIYGTMVDTFSSISFWVATENFVALFKKYIDAIRTSGLKLKQYNDMGNLDYCDCTCIGSNNTALMNILSNLSDALQYIIDGKIEINKNFIYTSLYDWATKLYENMYWA